MNARAYGRPEPGLAGRRVLVTGTKGFIGRNVMSVLRQREDVVVDGMDVDSPQETMADALARCDVVIHLAGVNRPLDESEYETGNAGLTRWMCARLTEAHNRPIVVYSSSAQAELDNAYGRSKLAAEEALHQWSEQNGAAAVVFRLPNVFGKWSRPEYNSVVASFCFNVSRNRPIRVDDADRLLSLVYIDDVVAAFLEAIDTAPSGFSHWPPLPSVQISIGELAALVRSLRASDGSPDLPDFSDRFTRQLYATYISYAELSHLAFPLDAKVDARGSLAELLREPHFGQVFVSRTRAGVTRGNHYHATKVERFMPVEGRCTIRLRHLDSHQVIEYEVSGEQLKVVTIPPGVVHSVENRGNGDMVVLFWADEIFDVDRPDTVYEPVIEDSTRP